MRRPDKYIGDIWEKLTNEDQLWYRDFVRGTIYGDAAALDRIFVNIPDDVQRRIMSELYYEWDAKKRAHYSIPKKYNSRYTEWDYCWKQPTVKPNKRRTIDGYYSQIPVEDSMGWAK